MEHRASVVGTIGCCCCWVPTALSSGDMRTRWMAVLVGVNGLADAPAICRYATSLRCGLLPRVLLYAAAMCDRRTVNATSRLRGGVTNGNSCPRAQQARVQNSVVETNTKVSTIQFAEWAKSRRRNNRLLASLPPCPVSSLFIAQHFTFAQRALPSPQNRTSLLLPPLPRTLRTVVTPLHWSPVPPPPIQFRRPPMRTTQPYRDYWADRSATRVRAILPARSSCPRCLLGLLLAACRWRLTTRPGAVREQAWSPGERVRAWTWDAVPASGIPVSWCTNHTQPNRGPYINVRWQ